VDVVLGAIAGALAASVVGPLAVASLEIRRHDREIAERDEDLEEWIVVRHRRLLRRFKEIEEQAYAAGVAKGGAIPAGRVASQTILLYEYREELRQARNFRLRIAVEERWTHRLVRRLSRRPFPGLEVPGRAQRLVDYWSEGTERNALTWSLEDILGELSIRATSHAKEPPE
jgi:hypothetical protein